MTMNDKGLIRAMKEAYKGSGYEVAVTDGSVLIQTGSWGVDIQADAVSNGVKSLIVLHNGSLPRPGSAVRVRKGECDEAIPEVISCAMEELAKNYTAEGGHQIRPTRVAMDGCQLWQTTEDLRVRLVDPEDQQILSGEKWDTVLIGNAIYGRNWFGSMYIRTLHPPVEDVILLDHLAQMQWVPMA